MNFLKDKRKRKFFVCITVPIAILAVIVLSCAIYLNDFYHADYSAINDFEPTNSVSKEVLNESMTVYTLENAHTGLIFYPGGKVEYTAYEPLMEALASEGILCVLIKMPFNLAVFDVNAAEGIQEQYPHIEKWYMGGHSLGGSMAASYLSENVDDFEGIVLLGSYSTADLSKDSFEVLSIYGSEDGVLNREKYTENKRNLPADFTEIVIDGGCHAYFGMYGSQDGDGIPSITNEEQIALTVDAVVEFVE